MPVRAGPTGSDTAWRVSAPEEKPTKPLGPGQLLLATDWLDTEFVQKVEQPSLIVELVCGEADSFGSFNISCKVVNEQTRVGFNLERVEGMHVSPAIGFSHSDSVGVYDRIEHFVYADAPQIIFESVVIVGQNSDAEVVWQACD